MEELGKVRETMLQQSRVEYHMQQNLLSHKNITIQYNTQPVEVGIDESSLHENDAYPIEVRLVKTQLQSEAASNILKNSAPHTADGDAKEVEERIPAKYFVGCDGAHSWLRKELQVQLGGDLTDSVFGVVNIVPKSNFPDLRRVCYLRASMGTILLVPRSNKEVRLYIPVESGSSLSDTKDLTFERIISAARKILSPYTLEGGSVSWWSVYRVGQHVGSHFSQHNERAFLVGDAAHTHSPKAGQRMSTSIQDAYNLGWKLRLVLQNGKGKPQLDPTAARVLLTTYESERRPVAQDLISFDRGYLKLFAAPSPQFDTRVLEGHEVYHQLVDSLSSFLCCAASKGRAANDETVGAESAQSRSGARKEATGFQAVYQADRITCWIHRRLQATGAFRVVVFAGDVASYEDLATNVERLGKYLADSNAGGLGSLTAGGAKAPVEVLMVHSADP